MANEEISLKTGELWISKDSKRDIYMARKKMHDPDGDFCDFSRFTSLQLRLKRLFSELVKIGSLCVHVVYLFTKPPTITNLQQQFYTY